MRTPMIMINRPLLTMVSAAVLLAGCNTFNPKQPSQPHTPNEHKHSLETPESQQTPEPIITPITPEAPKFSTVWEHIRAGYGLPEAAKGVLDAQIRRYTQHSHYFYKMSQQSEPYLHYVVNELQAHHMPLELALLPFIESSYNPAATSVSHVGMWQFGAATGRNFGLEQNQWYDGRKDVIASTDAAIRLLNKLYRRFDHDWLLAVAAYNAGDGAIQKAIDKNRRAGKPIDFWSLSVNKTTQGYIPQLLALSKIVANPTDYNFTLYPIADAPYFVKITVGAQINLAKAAHNSAIDAALLKKLNAGLTGWLTDPSKPRDVLVPVDSAATFRLQLDTVATDAPVAKDTAHNASYIVKSGENLWSIAKAHTMSVNALAQLNGLNSNSGLQRGQKLMVPSTVANEAVKTQKTSNYIIKPGDTLGKIAMQYNVSVNQIMQWNNITNATSIHPNQELMILANPNN